MTTLLTIYVASLFLTGLVLVAVGIGVSVPLRVRSAGQFDIAAGGLLLVFALVTVASDSTESWRYFPAYLSYLLSGIYLYRRHYIHIPEHRRRNRDVVQSLFLAIPGAGALLAIPASSGFIYILFLPGVPVGFAGMLFLIGDGVRALRGQRVLRRDLAAATFMVSMLYVYVQLIPEPLAPLVSTGHRHISSASVLTVAF